MNRDVQISGRMAGVLLIAMSSLSSASLAQTSNKSASAIANTPARQPADVERVASSRVHLNYRVKPGVEPITAVQLFVSTDSGVTWTPAATHRGTDGPIVFDAPSDGLYAFYLRFETTNATAPAPTAGTSPHRWVRVDRSAPVVQLLSIKADKRFDLNREVRLRWRSEDSDLPDRPVSIRYRSEQTKSYQLITELQPAEGEFRWTVPSNVFGRIEIKLSAADRAGNRGDYHDDRLTVHDDRAELRAASSKTSDMSPDGNNGGEPSVEADDEVNSQDGMFAEWPAMASEPDSGERPVDARAAIEAKRQYDQATWHRLRGELDVAVVKYRESLRHLPELAAARNDLAAVLCLLGDLEASEQEYHTLLKHDGRHRSGLKGLALVQAKRRNYRSAHATLQKLLIVDAEDAEAWLSLGDVCLFLGNRTAARAAWSRAEVMATAPRELRTRARKRLEIYAASGLSLGGRMDD